MNQRGQNGVCLCLLFALLTCRPARCSLTSAGSGGAQGSGGDGLARGLQADGVCACLETQCDEEYYDTAGCCKWEYGECESLPCKSSKHTTVCFNEEYCECRSTAGVMIIIIIVVGGIFLIGAGIASVFACFICGAFSSPAKSETVYPFDQDCKQPEGQQGAQVTAEEAQKAYEDLLASVPGLREHIEEKRAAEERAAAELCAQAESEDADPAPEKAEKAVKKESEKPATRQNSSKTLTATRTSMDLKNAEKEATEKARAEKAAAEKTALPGMCAEGPRAAGDARGKPDELI